MEDPCDLWVHVNHHLFLCFKSLVSLVDALLHPVGEITFSERVDNVVDISTWQLSNRLIWLNKITKFIRSDRLT